MMRLTAGSNVVSGIADRMTISFGVYPISDRLTNDSLTTAAFGLPFVSVSSTFLPWSSGIWSVEKNFGVVNRKLAVVDALRMVDIDCPLSSDVFVGQPTNAAVI